MRWNLMLQQYTLEVKQIKGQDNIIADVLSCVAWSDFLVPICRLTNFIYTLCFVFYVA